MEDLFARRAGLHHADDGAQMPIGRPQPVEDGVSVARFTESPVHGKRVLPLLFDLHRRNGVVKRHYQFRFQEPAVLASLGAQPRDAVAFVRRDERRRS